MDSSKKSVLLLWMSKVWGKPIELISELQDGCFFLHVLRAISHWSQVDDLDDADDETKLLAVKRFLQDFYSTEDFNGVLNFDSVFCDDIKIKEFELAKVAVVLLGVALIDKQGGDVVQKASMELPDHLHTDVVSLLEAVVQRHSGPKLMLSSGIEDALRTPSAGCSVSPQTRLSTPLAQCRKGSANTPLNTSFGISSPFRDININSVSPFVSYIQSPQLIRKAIYNEKELELRQLKSHLNEEMLLKEDVQLSLRDQIRESTKKDSEINELKNRIKELQFLQDAHDELEELRPRHAELEAKCDKFLSRQQKLDQYKAECRMLEKETTSQRDEIQSLLQEIQSLKTQNQEKSEILVNKNSIEKQMNLLKVQLEESSRMKVLMEEELMSLRSNLQMTEEKYKELKKLTEECNEESFQGESMGVVTDIQLGEMKSQVDRLSQERDDLQSEIHGLKSSFEEQTAFLEEMKKQVETSRQMNESLVTQLRGKCTDIESLKSQMMEKEADNKNALAVLKVRHDDELKAVRFESEKKLLSLVEGHEVSVKRLQTATEKVSLEKDSLIEEINDLGKKMQILQENHSKEIEVLRAESEKQQSDQNAKFEQEIVNQQEQNEKKRLELIAESEQQTKKLQDISEQKLLLQKEEQEIHLMKIKEELLSEIKSQKSSFEIQITQLQDVNEKRLCEKKELENEMESLRHDMVLQLESEKVENENQMKKLKVEHQDEIVGIQSKYEMELSALQGDSRSQITSLGDELGKLRKENAVSIELLRKEHENAIFELNEKMTSTVQQYEKEVDDLHQKIQDTEEQKTTLGVDLVKLKETTAASLEEQHNTHTNDLSTLQQEAESKLMCMELEHKNHVEQLEVHAQDTLNKHKDEFMANISQLQNELTEITSQKVTVDEQLSSLLNEHNELREEVSCRVQENSEILSGKCAVEDKLNELEKEHSEVLMCKTSLEEQVGLLQEEKLGLISQTEKMENELKCLGEKNSELVSNTNVLEENVARIVEENSDYIHKCKGLEEQLSTLQHQHSEVVSSKQLADEKLNILSLEKSEITSEIESVQEKVAKVLQENSEISSQKLAVENELAHLQESLIDVSTQRSSLEKELMTLQLEKSDIVSQKTFIEEELVCLRQENAEVSSQRNTLNEKVTDLLQQISEVTLLKVSLEEKISCKESDYAELKSENVDVQEKLLELQADVSVSLKSLTDKHDLEMSQLKGENEEKIVALIENHKGEIIRVEDEKDILVKEVVALKEKLDSAMAEVKQVEIVMTEKEKLTARCNEEFRENLDQERLAQKEHVTKIHNEWEERLSFEKAELEQLIVSNMKETVEAKLLLMQEEYDQLNVKLQEAADALACEKEEHNRVVSNLQAEADKKFEENKKEFGRLLAIKDTELVEKLTIEKVEKEQLLAKLSDEKAVHDQLVNRLQEEALENVNLEKQQIEKLEEDLKAMEEDKSELIEKISTLQEETTRMMQLQKGEHEREMQNVQESNEAKCEEVTAQCHKEVETLRAKMEDAASQNKTQLEEEVAKVRQETEMSYEASLDELKVKFEAAKESELKALSDQKAELSALREEHEEEFKNQQSKMDQKLKELQEENRQLRVRETAMLKNMETQMATANEFCNNLRQQLETANAKAAKLEANPASRERMKLYEQQLMKQKDTNASLNNALQIEKETSGKMHQRLETHISKHEKTKAILENAQKECRVYAIENNRLKTSLDYSERKLKSYQQQLELAANITLGSDAHFRCTVEQHDAELMNDSIDANTSVVSSYSLRSTTSTGSVRSRGSAKSEDGSPNETIISADSVMMRRETLAGSSDIRRKVPPLGFKANMLSCDNEPEEFEWDRLSELKRRNTLCLPHMKSSYPVETQTKKEEGSDEQAVRLSMMPGDISNISVKHGKRRSPRLSIINPDEDDKNICPNKKGKDETSGGTTLYFPLVRDGAVYQPPGAMPTRSTDKHKVIASGTARKKLTPSKLNKSPGKLVTKGRSYKSPGVKGRSPAPARNSDAENKTGVAFSIGFTPKKSSVGRSRMMQKKPANQDVSALLESKLRTSPRQKFRKPLATRNFRETGI